MMSTFDLITWAFDLRRVEPVEKLVAIYFAARAGAGNDRAEALIDLIDCGHWCCCKKEEAFGGLDGLQKFGLKLREIEPYKYLATLDLGHREIPAEGLPRFPENMTLYVVVSATGTKVGITSHLKNRMDQFRSASPLGIELRLKARGSRHAILWVERCCLAELAPHRIHGEWFSCPTETVLATVREWLRKVGIEPDDL